MQRVAAFLAQQAKRLTRLVTDAASTKDKYR